MAVDNETYMLALEAASKAKAELEDIAKIIHYPECWDTMAYPTLLSAIKAHQLECCPTSCIKTT